MRQNTPHAETRRNPYPVNLPTSTSHTTNVDLTSHPLWFDDADANVAIPMPADDWEDDESEEIEVNN